MKVLKQPKGAKDALKIYNSKEWFPDFAFVKGSFKDLPEPNLDFWFAATKAFSTFPITTSKGTTFELENLTADIVNSFLGCQINLRHTSTSTVVGSVIGADKTDYGVELLLRFDRRLAEFHDLYPDDLINGKVSIEVSKDPQSSEFYIVDEKMSIIKKLPLLEGERSGLQRTDVNAREPFLYQGKYKVIENIVPLRFTGLAITPSPADPQSVIYAVAADNTSPDTVTEVKMAKEALAMEKWPQNNPSPEDVAKANELQNLPRVYDMQNDVPDYIDIHESDANAMHQMACEYMSSDELANKKPYGNVPYADNGLQPDKIKRYPLSSPEKVRAAASYWGMPKNKAKYSPEQQGHITKAIAAAKRHFGIGDEKINKEGASVDALHESEIGMTDAEKATVDALTAKVDALASTKEADALALKSLQEKLSETEKSVEVLTAERDALKTAKEALEAQKVTAEKEAALTLLLSELEAILPAVDEAAKVSLKEQASAAIGNELAVKLMKTERLVEKLSKKDPEKSEDEAIKKLQDAQKDEKKDDKDEMSKSRKDTFSATPPPVITVAEYTFDPAKKTYTASEAALLF